MGVNRIKYLLIALVAVLYWSCREPYYPHEIEADEMMPVIQGIIQEGRAPEVKLHWAAGYNDDIIAAIHGASVYIRVNDTEMVRLEESTDRPGFYTTDRGLIGRTGFTYTLSVNLPDNRYFISSPQYMQEAPNVDRLFAVTEKKSFYTYSSDNKLEYREQKGLSFMADLSGENGINNESLYYRFKTKVLKQMYYMDGVGTINERHVFLWTTFRLDEPYSVNYTDPGIYGQTLKNHPIGFVEYLFDETMASKQRTGTYTAGWILTFVAYSISKDVYDYYKSVEKQLSSSGQVIAPIPSQVKGNMVCTNHPSDKFIGVFEASASDTVYRAFSFKELTVHYEKELENFPQDIPDGKQDFYPPSFWVYIY